VCDYTHIHTYLHMRNYVCAYMHIYSYIANISLFVCLFIYYYVNQSILLDGYTAGKFLWYSYVPNALICYIAID